MDERITIRQAVPEEAEELLGVYAPYVRETAISFEWEVPGVEEFRARIVKTLARYPYIAAVRGGRIVGYAYLGPFNERAAYDWAAETTVYVAQDVRRSGIGKRLCLTLEAIARRQHLVSLNACIGYPVREDEHLTRNSAQFHEHLGYRLVGEFHKSGRKFDRWYDMIWMEKLLDDGDGAPERFVPFAELGLTDEEIGDMAEVAYNEADRQKRGNAAGGEANGEPNGGKRGAADFILRSLRPGEEEETARMEQICFPPNEACAADMMIARAKKAPEMFLVAEEAATGRLAGMICGLATDEEVFRDEFFRDAELYSEDGRNVLLLGVEVLPEYRHRGLAARMMAEYQRRETERGREQLRLTCLEDKVEMYRKMGFEDLGMSASVWGGEAWHEMRWIPGKA